ncbi:PREDICTED: acidic repeat-containing protein isoform X2 [Populus euphratica]|uniref:Acidic repeat-containing protein isoform X2 n=1 Tax=Populus euphratica TaxID=75702 RepID=A0AAJ6T3H1_POPEU|nr:PREDICTED: acidic repeat-containing protein isoform X2 [Populus euphratica]
MLSCTPALQNTRMAEIMFKVTVIWRGNKFIVGMNTDASVKDLGDELQKLTDIRADTMRLIVPRFSNKSSKLLFPFSDEHSQLSLQEASIMEGKFIRMLGVSEDEVDKVLQNAKVDLRIAGFDEEEKRMRQRMSEKPFGLLKLPQGPYIFCDFRTLQIPGVELNPPASEALKRMHMLAADPGIVAIMNKHRWRVGIMTEMAPVGYVGVSPKCILGFNKDLGEEISLRLRTDDLKGFRKYESIKKTLLHELAHMLYSEHDANFYALDKQLNQEAASLDWTKSRGHTLSGVNHQDQYSEDFYVSDSRSSSVKLGGNVSNQLAGARASSVAAAYHRLADASSNSLGASEVHEEPDPDDSIFNMHKEPDVKGQVEKGKLDIENLDKSLWKPHHQPVPDEHPFNQNKNEPDPDDSQGNDHEVMDLLNGGIRPDKNIDEPDPDDSQGNHHEAMDILDIGIYPDKTVDEPDPDDSQGNHHVVMDILNGGICLCPDKTIDEPDPDDSQGNQHEAMDILNGGTCPDKTIDEPDPDDSQGNYHEVMDILNGDIRPDKTIDEPDPDDSLVTGSIEDQFHLKKAYKEPDPDESETNKVVQAEPNPDDDLAVSHEVSRMQIDEPDPDDEELRRIQDPVSVICSRLQKATETLRAELKSTEATAALQTLLKIIRNVIEHPDQSKFKRLRKANPIIQKNVASHQAAVEIVHVVGFSEEVSYDETGKADTYLVLKRNDPGLLWLAKSTLEACMA